MRHAQVRNETDVWIRGFDRWRIPIYQDGIPIYLPVDDLTNENYEIEDGYHAPGREYFANVRASL